MTIARPISTTRFRVVLLALVAAILVVPALVRASGSVTHKSTSPLRLNRGFEAPAAKASVTALRLLVEVSPCHADVELRASWTCTHVDEAIPHAPSHRPPDVLRGPPATSFA